LHFQDGSVQVALQLPDYDPRQVSGQKVNHFWLRW